MLLFPKNRKKIKKAHTKSLRIIFLFFQLKGKNVASFGDGPGEYKAYMDNNGLVYSYDAYDGAPFAEITTNGRVHFLDLSVPIYHLNAYDWVISIEVAEHIPAQFETIYIENLVRHAKEGIILSWSRPGQDGHSHVNNRDAEYVKQRLKSYGFTINESASDFLKEKSISLHLKNNVNVYFRNSQRL